MKNPFGRTQKIIVGGGILVGALSVFWTFVPPPDGVPTFAVSAIVGLAGVLTVPGAYIKGQRAYADE